MSKRRKSKDKSHRTTTVALRPQMRGALAPLRRMPGVLGSNVFAPRRSFLSDLRVIEDLRHAEPRSRSSSTKIQTQRYKRDDGTVAGFGPVHVRSRVLPVRTQVRLSFHQPERTLVCVRRKARRRVLYALQKIGRGRGAKKPKRARWTVKSFIRCNR